MTDKAQPKSKHIPSRSCIACRDSGAKRGFVRVVRTPEGSVEVDETGKKAGRGAYICRRRECWQEALRKERLDRALRAKLWQTDRDALSLYADRHFGPIERANA